VNLESELPTPLALWSTWAEEQAALIPQTGRALTAATPGCGPGGRGFESRHPPQYVNGLQNRFGGGFHAVLSRGSAGRRALLNRDKSR